MVWDIVIEALRTSILVSGLVVLQGHTAIAIATSPGVAS